ncbi:hypothetical protein HanRHA438_Chr09g0429361 [Helianthus annuus]|nr:hypothetical protein HanRHA438_Chr09g0429361 [Helianthus annuus]
MVVADMDIEAHRGPNPLYKAIHPPSLTKFLTVCPTVGPFLPLPLLLLSSLLSRTCKRVLIVSNGIVTKAETPPAIAALTPWTAITVVESGLMTTTPSSSFLHK